MARKLDIALVAACVLACAVEATLRPELLRQPASMAMVLVVAVALALRRTRPLPATVAAFSGATIATLTAREPGPYSGAFILVLPYALGRNGTHRDILIGLAFMGATYVASVWRGEMATLSDAIGGAVVMLFPGVIGLALRFRAAVQLREVEHAKLREREQLARELHDSVAHHVMAISIQAQAARARPEGAGVALSAIETEARRTLAELRSIVGALRDEDAEAGLVPAGRIAEVASFARDASTGLAVAVELSGDLSRVAPTVERAVYRIAQESITNAAKHARGATRIDLKVVGDPETIQLTAQDDGEDSTRQAAGFGLIGMTERVALLGGSFEAGPGRRGWFVRAVLPRKGKDA